MNNANRKTTLRALLLSVGVAVTVGVAYWAGWVDRLEWLTYDWRMTHFRADKEADPKIAVVLIDDASLKAMDSVAGRWPWPRSIYGDLLEYFSFGEPKAVVFDITFTEKQGYGDGSLLLNPHDQRLVDATHDSPFTYHASRLVLDSEDEFNKGILNRPLPADYVAAFDLNHRYGNGFFSGFHDRANNNAYLPFTELYQAAGGIGVVDVNPDRDGIYRRARLFHRYQDNYFPSLSTAPLLDLLKPEKIRRDGDAVQFGDMQIPVDGDSRYLVNYYGRFNTYSFSGLMASLQQMRDGDLENLMVNPSEFQDKIVFVGASAAGLEDLKNTSVNSKLPGVFIHASIASNILDRDFLRPASPAVTLALILLFAPITCFGVFYVRKFYLQSALPLLLAAAYIGWSLFQYRHQVVTELVTPLMSIGLAWAMSFASLLLTEGREKLRFKRMMSQYLSPAVLSTVVNSQEGFAKAEIGSKECLSILFSDIRSFTSLSETLEPEKVVEMLNYYFSNMTDAIFAHHGTIDKFIGDAIMAFWGAPITIADHADKATHAALEMIKRLEEVNTWLDGKGYPHIHIGIGIHTGEVILGNIGSENKLDYTIIGDNVNLASRMEGLTKNYDCPVLITEATYARLSTPIPCRVVDLVRVKGKKVPIRIYHPMGLPNDLSAGESERLAAVAERTEQAFSLYLDRRWQDAIAVLEQLPDDRVRAMMLERCRHYLEQPAPADWDGVHTMTTK